jgi:hypothetical protein
MKGQMEPHTVNPLNPKKLLLSKWTVVKSAAKQKHFLVAE